MASTRSRKLVIDIKILGRVKDFFTLDNVVKEGYFSTNFERLVRAMSINQNISKQTKSITNAQRLRKKYGNELMGVNSRLTDVLSRLEQISWMKNTFIEKIGRYLAK